MTTSNRAKAKQIPGGCRPDRARNLSFRLCDRSCCGHGTRAEQHIAGECAWGARYLTALPGPPAGSERRARFAGGARHSWSLGDAAADCATHVVEAGSLTARVDWIDCRGRVA